MLALLAITLQAAEQASNKGAWEMNPDLENYADTTVQSWSNNQYYLRSATIFQEQAGRYQTLRAKSSRIKGLTKSDKSGERIRIEQKIQIYRTNEWSNLPHWRKRAPWDWYHRRWQANYNRIKKKGNHSYSQKFYTHWTVQPDGERQRSNPNQQF